MNSGNWPTKELSWFVGLLGNVYAFFGADGAIHMSEEIQNAAVVVPKAIVFSIILNGAMGLGIALVLLFCIRDIDAALHRNILPGVWKHHRRGAHDFYRHYTVSLRHSRYCCLCIPATLGLLARQSCPWPGVYSARQLQIRDSCARSPSNCWDCLSPRSNRAWLFHGLQRHRFFIRRGPI